MYTISALLQTSKVEFESILYSDSLLVLRTKGPTLRGRVPSRIVTVQQSSVRLFKENLAAKRSTRFSVRVLGAHRTGTRLNVKSDVEAEGVSGH